MTKALANVSSQDDVAAGEVLVELSAAAAEGNWLKITPRGEVTTRNGINYTFDPEALAARFAADDVKIAIDLDHGIARLASQGHTVPAVGWIEELEARADGLYGRVEWLEAGKAALAAKTHRYFSPTFPHVGGKATWLHSVALVTSPALSKMPALADASAKPTEPSMSKAIAAALGLSADATETACLSAIATLTGGGTVSSEVHQQTLTTLSATTTELETLKASIRQGEIDALLDGALAEKRIVPAQREKYANLCATDNGFKDVKALLAATPKKLGDSGLDHLAVDTGDAGDDVDPVTLAAEARALVTAAAQAGTHLTIQAAVAQATAKRKEARA